MTITLDKGERLFLGSIAAATWEDSSFADLEASGVLQKDNLAKADHYHLVGMINNFIGRLPGTENYSEVLKWKDDPRTLDQLQTERDFPLVFPRSSKKFLSSTVNSWIDDLNGAFAQCGVDPRNVLELSSGINKMYEEAADDDQIAKCTDEMMMLVVPVYMKMRDMGYEPPELRT